MSNQKQLRCSYMVLSELRLNFSINLKVPEYVVSVLNEIEVYIFVSVQER